MPLTQKKTTKDFHDFELKNSDFLASVIGGLSTSQKTLPSKFFYDKVGSKIFDNICELDEYYPTRLELAIFETYKYEIADQVGECVHLVEFGSGSSIKVRVLMEALNSPLGYLPIDISREHLIQSAEDFSAQFPHIALTAICADYTSEFDLPVLAEGHYVGFYPGSTIGNFTPAEAVQFLRNTKKILGRGGFLIGVDLIKDHRILNAAYDDALGVTATFNKNILARCNRELGTLFNLDTFEHSTFFNTAESRVEMHLVSNINQTIKVGDRAFHFKKDETIHTENSYKYTLGGFADLAKSAGLKHMQSWTDPDKYFSVHYLRID